VTHDALPTVTGDKVQLVELFQNLIGNAIKFQGDRPAEIHVGARRSDREWLFSVSDKGIGIDREHLENIFVIFRRVPEQSGYPGTGLGLAICKKIVEHHGGRIWVESKTGKGSTFYFTIRDTEETGNEQRT
jgi:chemotaxis family two-component system sensor kinase Cph1